MDLISGHLDAPAFSRDKTGGHLYEDGIDKQRLEILLSSIDKIEPSQSQFSFDTDEFPSQAREKKNLLDAIESTVPENKIALLKKSIEQFESRAATDGLEKAQIEATYAQVKRIIASPSDLLSKERHLALVEQILKKAADPTSIDQGEHGTCGAAVLEVRTYWRSPERATKLVADAALTGEVFTPKGVPLLIDVQPHDTSKNFEVKNGQRDHAGELFQVAAINLALNTAPDVVPGTQAYRQRDKPKAGSGTGEVVIDYSRKPPAEKIFGGLQIDQMLRINQIVSGHAEKDIVLWQSNRPAPDAYGKPFTTESEMEKAIDIAKRNGSLPVILFVHTGNEPLWKDSPINIDGGKGGWHYVSITDIDNSVPRKVSVDSTWWKNADHGKNGGAEEILVSDLYVASLSPKAAEFALSKRDQIKEQTSDAARQISMVRQKWVAGLIDANELEKSLAALAVNSRERWNREAKSGTGNRDEQTKSIKTLMEAVDRLPSENKLRILNNLNEQGYLSSEDYQSALIATAIEMKDQRKLMVADGDFRRKAEQAFIKAEKQYLTQLDALDEASKKAVLDAVKNRRIPLDRSFFGNRAREREARRNPSLPQ